MEDRKLDQETAKLEITRSDKSLRGFIKRYFDAELEDPIHYDLVVNTDRFSFEAAASLVVDALSLRNQAGPSVTPKAR
jgi:cytidylate kinase